MAKPIGLYSSLGEVPHPPMQETWPLFLCICAVVFWILLRPLFLWLMDGVKFSWPQMRRAWRWMNFRLDHYLARSYYGHKHHPHAGNRPKPANKSRQNHGG